MKTSLEIVPEHKRKDLLRAVEIIKEEIDFEMLILFGSYARGEAVEDIDAETLFPKYQNN